MMMSCFCGAPTPCERPSKTYIRPGDYVVSTSVAQSVEREVEFSLAHYSPIQKGVTTTPDEASVQFARGGRR